MDRVICDSGLTGWRARLRESYGDYRTFLIYCRTHDIHGRLGYDTPQEAWRANPLVRGSVRPEDLRRVEVGSD